MTETKKGRPKRGVSFYSYRDLLDYSLTLEDCFKDVYDMGATCFEILSSDIENYPHPSAKWVDNFFKLCEQYELEPGEMGHWCDTRLYRDRAVSDEEALQQLEQDFKLANLLGFKFLRTKITVTNFMCDPMPGWQSYIEKALPLAEKYDVKMCTEVHSPTTLSTPHIEEYLESIRRTGTEHFGFNLDFSIFRDKFPEESIDPLRAQNLVEIKALNNYSKPEEILHVMPYVYCCHAKFNYLNEDFEEVTIPYQEVLNTLIDNGYNGCLLSEYEGPGREDFNFLSDQLRRHHIMMNRILGY